jgi:hypothetical protein
MNCLSCRLPSGYNRVLVEAGTEVEVGGLCVECEEHRIGDGLGRASRAETDGCALCAGDAHVRVPEWSPEMDVRSDGTVVWTDYRVTEGTPGLCEEHAEGLAGRGSGEEPSFRTPPRP